MLSFLKDIIRTILSPLAMPLTYLAVIWTVLTSIFRKAEWGIYVLVAMIPLPNIWYQFHAYPLGKDFIDIIIFSVILGIYVNKNGFQRSGNSRLLMVFIIANYLALWHTSIRFSLPLPVTTSNILLPDFKNYAEMIFLYYLVVNSIKDEKTLKNISVIMASVVLFIAVREFRNFSPSGAFSYDKRAEGPFWVVGLGANHLGSFMAHYGAALLGLYFFEENRRIRWLYLATVLFSIHPLFFSYSRGAYLAELAVFIFFGLIKKRSLLLMVFALLVTWQTVLPTTVVERITMTESSSGELESSAAERVELWDHAVSLFQQNPVFGIGFGAFGFTRPAGSLTDTHNFYLRVLSEQGVVGISLFLLVLAAAFGSGLKLYKIASTSYLKGLGLGFMGCIIGVAVSNLFGDRWSYFVLGGYFFVFWGLVDRGILLAQEIPVTASETAAIPGQSDDTHAPASNPGLSTGPVTTKEDITKSV